MGAEPGPGATASDHQEQRSHSGTLLRLSWRPYRFQLAREMVTSQGAWSVRQGWLLRLEGAEGRVGWGEAALPPMAIAADASSGQRITPAATGDQQASRALSALPRALSRQAIETLLPGLPAPLACALGMALAELDGLGSPPQGGWLAAPPSALLLPAGAAALVALAEARAAERPAAAGCDNAVTGAVTVKWKVASGDDTQERGLLEAVLERLPADGRLRLDANGGWDRATAWRWAERLAGEPRLEWLEQPLPPGDREGLEALTGRLPVALDESLRLHPDWMAGGWRGWQVRRPLAEGDPRPLLAALRAGTPRLMLSTALETGIGRRFLHHLAGLQVLGPTPTAPGLAPGWRPRGELFARDPETVWEAAG